MYRSLLILLFSGLLFAGGCGSEPSAADKAPTVRKATLTEDQAIEKAKDAVRQHDSFADSATYEVTPIGDAGWQITVTSGREVRFVALDGTGEVIKYDGR